MGTVALTSSLIHWDLKPRTGNWGSATGYQYGNSCGVQLLCSNTFTVYIFLMATSILSIPRFPFWFEVLQHPNHLSATNPLYFTHTVVLILPTTTSWPYPRSILAPILSPFQFSFFPFLSSQN